MSEVQDAIALLGRPIPSPAVTVETKPFWDAAREGRLLVKRCRGCGQAFWYPRALCPICHSADTVWEENVGRGKVFSFSISRRVPARPYAIAYVCLDDGPAMLTNIVDAAPEDLRIGMPVRVKFHETTDGGPPVPVFAPL